MIRVSDDARVGFRAVSDARRRGHPCACGADLPQRHPRGSLAEDWLSSLSGNVMACRFVEGRVMKIILVLSLAVSLANAAPLAGTSGKVGTLENPKTVNRLEITKVGCV